VIDMDWRHRANCRDEEPELFFPVGTAGPALRQTEEAKAVCRGCPVREDCLSWALQHQPYGIAGGLTEDERQKLKVKRGLARPAVHRPAGVNQRERAVAGRKALRAGATPAEVADEFGVHPLTAQRWAERVEGEDAQLAGAGR
jgi:hypothetical protein